MPILWGYRTKPKTKTETKMHYFRNELMALLNQILERMPVQFTQFNGHSLCQRSKTNQFK